MIQYTTPTITLNIRGFTFPEECDVYVTFKQGNVRIDKTDAEIIPTETGTTLKVPLTQAETGQFIMACSVLVQVNWITPEGYRNATKIAQANAFENLLDRVIVYGT